MLATYLWRGITVRKIQLGAFHLERPTRSMAQPPRYMMPLPMPSQCLENT